MKKWGWIVAGLVVVWYFFLRRSGAGTVNASATAGAGAGQAGTWGGFFGGVVDSLTGRAPLPTGGPSYLTGSPGAVQAGTGPSGTKAPPTSGALGQQVVAPALSFFQALFGPPSPSGTVTAADAGGTTAYWSPSPTGQIDSTIGFDFNLFGGGDVATSYAGGAAFGPPELGATPGGGGFDESAPWFNLF